MIIRTKKNRNYTVISNFALNDPNLSLKAKGLWSFIMSKPDKWNISSRNLSSELKESRNTVMTTLKELENARYLKRGEVREKDGKFSQGENTLYEEPWLKNPTTANEATSKVLSIVSTKDTETEVSEPPKEKEDKVSKLFWMVVKKYGLPIVNANNIRKWIGELKKAPDSEKYLTMLLDHDLRDAEGEFRPTLNSAFDILNKKIKIQRFYNGGEDKKELDPRVFGSL